MISSASRSLLGLSQLRATCLGRCRVESTQSSIERVSASYLTSTRPHFSPTGNGVIPIALAIRRHNATKAVSRPKAHTGRTTTSPRKAKTTSTTGTTTSKNDTGTEEVVVEKAKPKAKPKAKSKAKPKKATGTEEVVVEKAKPKAKPKAKSKAKRKAKPKPKRKPKKKLTEEQKGKLEIKRLKEIALINPKELPATAFMVLSQEHLKDSKKPLGGQVREAAAEYRDLSVELREHYNHIANQNKLLNQAAYREWIRSYTPNQIRLANIARLSLKRKGAKPARKLQDDRQVKQNVPANFYFMKERRESGDFVGISITDTTRRLAIEWKELSGAEKEKYLDLAALDMARYVEEKKMVYNIDVGHRKSSPDL
ncbi:hypothetical protein MMC12_000245 [Toensbergia leucococca]|nr:hypothetical protein [Toensbergia leucococca]